MIFVGGQKKQIWPLKKGLGHPIYTTRAVKRGLAADIDLGRKAHLL